MQNTISPFKRDEFQQRQQGWAAFLICLAITILTGLIYAQVGGHSFLSYDDDIYITNNEQIKNGLTAGGIAWAFSSIYESNWIPLTWLSHMLDVQIYGMTPGGHHLTNVILHLANSALLFFLFRTLTAALWRPALLALLFAAHPLHVESVAWAAERKDLLCGLFFILALFFHARYAQRGGPGNYLLAVLSFMLGALAKPMIVTLPLVLILLDRWPLARLHRKGNLLQTACIEKIPFLAGSVILSIITIAAQSAGGSIASMARHSLQERLLNAATSYLSYLGKIFVPVNLSVFYPYPQSPPLWQGAAALLALAAISVLALTRLKERPYIATGWLWFIGTLLPVIGLVQVGEQAMADRYAYLPVIGILIVVVWGGEELWRRFPIPVPIVRGALLLIVGLFGLIAWRQTSHWQSQHSLFQHAVQVTENNYVAYFQLGNAQVAMDKLPAAQRSFSKSIEITPTAKAYNNLAYTEERTGMTAQAEGNYRQAIRLDPDNIEAHYNLGLLMLRQWRPTAAAREFDATLRLEPNHLKARQNLARAQKILAAQGRGSQP